LSGGFLLYGSSVCDLSIVSPSLASRNPDKFRFLINSDYLKISHSLLNLYNQTSKNLL